MVKPRNVKPGIVKIRNLEEWLNMSKYSIIKYKMSGRFHLGGKTLLKLETQV